MVTTAASIEASVTQLLADIAILNDIANGDSSTTVTTDAGSQPSIAKFYADLTSTIMGGANTVLSYCEEWANADEDTLVSVAAGGDASTEYSAKHWAAKAAASQTAVGLIESSLATTVADAEAATVAALASTQIVGMGVSIDFTEMRITYTTTEDGDTLNAADYDVFGIVNANFAYSIDSDGHAQVVF